MRSIDRLKDRWLLVKKWRDGLYYYRGPKKYPTKKFELAYSYPTKQAALKNKRFMHTTAQYYPIEADEKMIFKLKLQGIK